MDGCCEGKEELETVEMERGVGYCKSMVNAQFQEVVK